MQKKQLVSILIASFNKEKLAKICINSCIKQTYKNVFYPLLEFTKMLSDVLIAGI